MDTLQIGDFFLSYQQKKQIHPNIIKNGETLVAFKMVFATTE